MSTSFLKSKLPLVLIIALAFSASASAALKVGDTVPDLARFKLEGTAPETKGRVLLIDFWASWCAPCKQSFPVMKELHEKFGSRGLVIIAISVDEDKSAMATFLKRNPAPFVTLRDGEGKTPEAFGADKMPTSLIVGSDGKIVAIHSGFEGEATRKKYLTEIEAALKAAGK
jgi:thiol-disulfide isomerase/thioredoxin